eukprot:CAMPEP_0167761388 /NCGR_PEP_ID=MMETSP0110_2-20121227/12139_1 /TAXON_ID=629695 /ORGANISM="Gymnochlora sp., Strain CCMP2014" /LENGTH=159 /DNA_ID=CAMNT_0007648055 /DNA_START=121 /DNA_END=600 /DNA_ORIENTATION=-
MKPHPEGGYYVETYRSDIVADVGGKKRSASTAIYFLLTPGLISHLHILTTDEVWHFYKGDPIVVFELDRSSADHIRFTTLGTDYLNGQKMQHVVKAGTWFGSFHSKKGKDFYSFVGCTVAPAFEFSDFKLAGKDVPVEDILKEFPKAEDKIKSLKLVIS